MVDLDASFFHHLLELAVADRVRHIPAHAPEDDLPLKMTALNSTTVERPVPDRPRSCPGRHGGTALRQNPAWPRLATAPGRIPRLQANIGHVSGNHDDDDHVRVPIEIFGGGMNDEEARAKGDRLLQRRRQKRVVDQDPGSSGFRTRRDRADIDDALNDCWAFRSE